MLTSVSAPLFKLSRFRRALTRCFVVDFLALAERLVVEIDGSYHQLTRRADARRDAAAGYRVLRLEVELVMHQLPEALARIKAALAAGPVGTWVAKL